MTVYTGVTWNIQQIIAKVRSIVGMGSTDQISDQTVVNYINTYYSFEFPFELKEQTTFQPFNFQTLPNQDVYSFSGLTQTGEPVIYADGYPLVFYNSRDLFFQDWPQEYASDQVATGDGSTPTFAGSTLGYPIIEGTYLITDGMQICSDPTGSGILSGNGSGTIDYVTGAFEVTFTSAPASSATIYDKYQAYQAARPQGALFDSTNITTSDTISFTFRPVPDQVYQITLQGFIVQSQLMLSTAVPMQTEWGQLIAYGAALQIFSDRGDMVQYDNNYRILKRYENIALGRYIQQLDNVQSVPRF
jgi:hypothetical protein